MSKTKARQLLKYEMYWDEYAREDGESIKTICDSASITLTDVFHFHVINTSKNIDTRALACIFSKIFDAILEKLRSLEDSYNSYEINICDRLLIGYDTSDDDDDEKTGNFMIYMRNIASNLGIVNPTGTEMESLDSDASSLNRVVVWNGAVVNGSKVLNDIAISALKKIEEDLEFQLSSPEYIWPIFSTIYEHIINYVKCRITKDQLSDIEINFISCFDIGAMESEDGEPTVYIRPNINSKLMLKNDAKASTSL